MGTYANAFGPHAPERTYVEHAYAEQRLDLGEVELNYVVVGGTDKPALLLIPGQTESWWGYEKALRPLSEHFQCYAVDLRGQGRSTRTPGRYTLDNMGNDLVRFIERAIGRPTFVSGLSSGGLLAAWLSAYAKPEQVISAVCEDPPLFHSEVDTSTGPSMRQGVGPIFALWSKYLGDQWSIGDWDGMIAAAPRELPPRLAALMTSRADPPQNLKEYDPEWARAFWTGSMAASCDHARMLAAVKVPVLLTHHFHGIDEKTGHLIGALSELGSERARQLIEGAGQRFEYRSLPRMAHSLHGQDPALFASILVDWTKRVPAAG